MTDRPILFSASMVQALLAGRKTQTRRILKPRPHGDVIRYGWDRESGATWTDQSWESRRLPWWAGDRLYVRETWRTRAFCDDLPPRDLVHDMPIEYEAGMWSDLHRSVVPSRDSLNGKVRGAIHMPRWASRLTLTVTDVRVERLQEISEADAKAEGVREFPCTGPSRGAGATFWSASPRGYDEAMPVARATPVAAFRALWDHINGDGAWDANLWVVALTFTVEKRNIDAC